MDLQLSSTALKVAEAMAAGKRMYVEQALDYLSDVLPATRRQTDATNGGQSPA